MKSKINWKWIFNTFVLIFTFIILLYFLFSENGLFDLIKILQSSNKKWLSIALLSHLSSIFVDAYLTYIFANQLSQKFSFKKSFKVAMVGQFFSAITPGASGGQPMQIYALKMHKMGTGNATSILIQKFLIYQTVVTFYSFIAIILRPKLVMNEFSPFIRLLVTCGFIVQIFFIGIIILFSLNKKLTKNLLKFIFNILAKLKIINKSDDKIKNIETQLLYFHVNNKNLYESKSLLAKTYILTFLQISFMYIIPYFIYRSFNLHGEKITDLIAAESFVAMISSFIPLPGGSGVAEGSFYLFFSAFFTEYTIKSAVIVWRFITYFLTIIISAPFSRLPKNSYERSDISK